MSLPDRDDADPEYRFDLTEIFETPTDWEDARENLEAELDALEARAETPLESTADLRALLERTEACYRRKQRLELYAKLAENVNQGDDSAGDRLTRYGELDAGFEASIAAVRRRLRDTDVAELDGYLAGLEAFRRYGENLRRQASHVSSEPVEDAIATVEGRRLDPAALLNAVWNDFDPPTLDRPDGTTVEIRRGDRRHELSSPDRDYRRRVYEAYWDELGRFESVLTRAYAANLRAAAAEAEVRDYASVRELNFRQRCYPESGLRSALPETVHEAMLDGIRSRLEPYHRALERRRRRLGVDELRPWDLDVTTADSDTPEISFERAKSHVVAALEPLGDEYVARVESVFDDRRIDIYPGEDKWDVPAYCPSSSTDGPFVLANFRRNVRTTFFVCHELGHALHVEHHREGPARYATCPRPVEEIPSILHEILLAEYLIDTGGALASAARNRLLECLGGNFYESAMASAFVREICEYVESREKVSPDRARSTWRELLQEFRAPVALDDDAGRTWLGRGERDAYSNYQYVLGATGALAVRERLREGDLTPETYREFLRSTGREDSIALFERLGCDVTTPAPFERAGTRFAAVVDAAGSN